LQRTIPEKTTACKETPNGHLVYLLLSVSLTLQHLWYLSWKSDCRWQIREPCNKWGKIWVSINRATERKCDIL